MLEATLLHKFSVCPLLRLPGFRINYLWRVSLREMSSWLFPECWDLKVHLLLLCPGELKENHQQIEDTRDHVRENKIYRKDR